jgi:hypothetical protein
MSMPAAGNMTNIIKTDPIVARNFYLYFPKYHENVILQSVNSITVEMEVTKTTQVTKGGKADHAKTVGVSAGLTPEVEMTRMAPQHKDRLWDWLDRIRSGGFSGRTADRELLQLNFYDSTNTKLVSQFTMEGAWPFKIVTDQVEVTSSEAVKEVITLCCESVTRTV